MSFFDAPHRPYFVAGLVQAAFALILWMLWLLGAFAGAYPIPRLPVPAVAVHGFLMIYGLFPFFVFGFLATTYPRWLQVQALMPSEYRGAFLLRLAGLGLVYAGLALGAAILISGILIMAMGDARLLMALFSVYRRGHAAVRPPVRLFNIALALEVGGLLLYAAAFAWGSATALAWAIRLGLYAFLVPTLFGVSYRMLPFFTAAVLPGYLRPAARPWIPLGFLAATAGHALLAAQALYAPLAVLDGGIAVVAYYHAWLWFEPRVRRHGLLLLLYLGFAWLGLGFFLYAIRDVQLLRGGLSLGRGPLHALGLGFALSLVVAMVTRVSRGHSGRPLASDRSSWVALAGVQGAALLRVAADIPALNGLAPYDLSVFAAPLALAALLPWILTYLRILATSAPTP